MRQLTDEFSPDLETAVPARAQSCPAPSNAIHDYVTTDGKRDLGVELCAFCAHQALIASEAAAKRAPCPAGVATHGEVWSARAGRRTANEAAGAGYSARFGG